MSKDVKNVDILARS